MNNLHIKKAKAEKLLSTLEKPILVIGENEWDWAVQCHFGVKWFEYFQAVRNAERVILECDIIIKYLLKVDKSKA